MDNIREQLSQKYQEKSDLHTKLNNLNSDIEKIENELEYDKAKHISELYKEHSLIWVNSDDRLKDLWNTLECMFRNNKITSQELEDNYHKAMILMHNISHALHMRRTYDSSNKGGKEELINWLKREKYLIDENSDAMTEEFETAHKWELSRNTMINKTIAKIEELNIEKYKISKNFEMNISFEDLINYNKTCKIDTNSAHNFECYNGIAVYVSHPDSDEKFSIHLGVAEDGIVYEGDYGCLNDFKEVPIEKGLDILVKCGELINMKSDFESLLSASRLDKDVVEIKIR